MCQPEFEVLQLEGSVCVAGENGNSKSKSSEETMIDHVAVVRVALLFVLVVVHGAFGFAPVATPSNRPRTTTTTTTCLLAATPSGTQAERCPVEQFLAQEYPAFYNFLLEPCEDVIKTLRKNADVGFTVFAVADAALEALGEKKTSQLADPRNLETVEKMASYHVIGNEAVTMETLFSPNVGGIVTMGGEVDIGPSQSGGFFGIGGKDDGGVKVGPSAKIQQSIQVGPGIVHEVDALISPSMLWRYIDQLRIPGTS